MFVHAVYFWLKRDAPAPVQLEMLQSVDTLLKNIPTVRHIWAGYPAMTPRDVVDNSYSIGLLVTFFDSNGHEVYANHPLHLEFIEKFKPYWERVQVYDFQ